MAIPTAVTNGDQTFAYGELPKLTTLDGSGSFDADGDPITAYDWRTIDVPPGSAAELSATNVVAPTFTADVPGTYLFLLVVTAGGQESASNREVAPASAYARVAVTTQHRALVKPATGERLWGDRMNTNIDELDEMAGDLDVVEGTADALQAAVDVLEVDVAALQADVAALETRPPGRHHFLRPDFLVGVNDRTWTVAQVNALFRSHLSGATRVMYAGRDADGLLLVDIAKGGTNNLAGVLWPGVAGDWQATLDARIFIDGNLGAPDVSQFCCGFGWSPTKELSVPVDLRGVGVRTDASPLGNMSYGVTTPPVDWGGALVALSGTTWTSAFATELMFRLTRKLGVMWGEVSIGGGGFLRVASVEWDDAAGVAGYFALFGSLHDIAAGLRIRSTGFRLRAADDAWFGGA